MRCRNFYHWWYCNWGGPGPLAPPLATPMQWGEFFGKIF